MKEVDSYKIDYRNLAEGSHQFDYALNEQFFKSVENSLIGSGSIEVKVHVEKHAAVGTIELVHNGMVMTLCDRCLEELELSVTGQTSLLIKGPNEIEAENEEVIYLNDEGVLMLREVLYDYVSLSMPITKYCDVDPPCHSEIMNKLHSDDEQNDHPAWSELKNLNL